MKWAKAGGKIEKLLDALCQENPGNVQLQEAKREILKSSLFDDVNLIKDSNLIILQAEWNKLYVILLKINNLYLISEVCYLILENIIKNKDVLGNCPELINLTELDALRSIFLEKYPYNDNKIPTIAEFAKRLSRKVKEPCRSELNQWLRNLERKLDFKVPDYSERQSLGIAQAYLLVTVNPQGSDKFYLEAELIPNECQDAQEKFKLELSAEKSSTECSWNEISDKIYQFINQSHKHLYQYNKKYILTIELFLPLSFLSTSVDLEKIPIGNDRRQPIGNEYRFVLRSRDRISMNGGEYLSRLSLRWDKLETWQKSLTRQKIKSSFEHLNCVEQQNWDELANNWELQEKLGVKICCGLPKSNKEKIDLFFSMLRGGVPIAVWTRCDSLPNLNIEEELDKILCVKSLKDLNNLTECIWKIRKEAHSKQNEVHNYFGYHLGILCDNPNRIPFSLSPENEPFLETGW